MNKAYEVFSLVTGVAAVITIVFFLLTEKGCIVMFEPIWWIRIPEIIIGFIVSPYYLLRLNEVIQK